MNERLIGEFLAAACQAPAGQRGTALVAMVAEHCAKICDALHDGEVKDAAAAAAETMRAAFVGEPQLTPTAEASRIVLAS